VSSGGDAVRLERIFEADIDRVFRAFTDPDELVHWWGPMNVRTSMAEIDLRVGGDCRWVMHPGGQTAVLYGRIVDLDPPHLLVMTNRWDGQNEESLVTLRLTESPHGHAPRAHPSTTARRSRFRPVSARVGRGTGVPDRYLRQERTDHANQ
jgi:uncharacterized protein YndB with AHSA1/START domain